MAQNAVDGAGVRLRRLVQVVKGHDVDDWSRAVLKAMEGEGK